MNFFTVGLMKMLTGQLVQTCKQKKPACKLQPCICKIMNNINDGKFMIISKPVPTISVGQLYPQST